MHCAKSSAGGRRDLQLTTLADAQSGRLEKKAPRRRQLRVSQSRRQRVGIVGEDERDAPMGWAVVVDG